MSSLQQMKQPKKVKIGETKINQLNQVHPITNTQPLTNVTTNTNFNYDKYVAYRLKNICFQNKMQIIVFDSVKITKP